MRKTRFLTYCIIFLLIAATISIFVTAKKGGDGGVPCDGKRYDGGSIYQKGACVKECGSPEECYKTHPGGKGPGCELGQVCSRECECEWVDKDLDGYVTEYYQDRSKDDKKKPLDCDDNNPYICPGAEEVCDNADNDCNGLIDENEVCKKYVYMCKTDNFITQHKGDGKELSYGYCLDGTWCADTIVGERASCSYQTKEEDIGQNNFYTYVCDTYDCFRFVQGSFVVYDYRLGGAATCIQGECNYETKEWCNELDLWQTEGWCTSECGKRDSECEGDCEHGGCDIIKKLYCNYGEWINPGLSYCFPGYCGTQDPSCDCTNEKDGCCTGEADGVCDPDCMGDSDPDCVGVCTSSGGDCCVPDSDGVCDPDCIFGVDPDCQTGCGVGADGCCTGEADGVCDPDCMGDSDPDCVGVCTSSGGDCCVPDSDGVCDPDCIFGVDPDCAAHPCDENWVCKKWDLDCDGIHDTHTCLEWKDTNNCNTFYNTPSDLQDCHKEFTCQENDDKDNDGYPKRACYDVLNNTILEEIDCNDNNPYIYPGAKEVCNGEDDDCDDTIDEGCPCTEGETQSCGKNRGICKPGIQNCVKGYWTLCGGPGYRGPEKEVCDDGLDNNCDGFIDENCNCIEGETQECGTDTGICEKGWQVCYNNTFGSVCNDETKAATEICDNSLDDDCDGYTDGEDSNCQVETPVMSADTHCYNRKQDGDEEGVDCGGSCPNSCDKKAPACEYGEIYEKCVCGKATYINGYCCNGKYSIIPCKEKPKDSDNDGCYDDQELQMGTDIHNKDTDGDGLLDCDTSEEFPLCNEDGICDSERDYPETQQNCSDCMGEEPILSPWGWLILIIILIALMGIGGYLLAKFKGYNLSDLIKRKKKKEEPTFHTWLPKKNTRKPTGKLSLEIVKPALKSFVNRSLDKGHTKLQVRQAALKSGWTNEQITEALKGKESHYKLFK